MQSDSKAVVVKPQIQKMGNDWVFTPFPGRASNSYFFGTFEGCCAFVGMFIDRKIALIKAYGA